MCIYIIDYVSVSTQNNLTNKINYLGVTLTKKVKDLYDKKFRSLKKEIKEDLRR